MRSYIQSKNKLINAIVRIAWAFSPSGRMARSSFHFLFQSKILRLTKAKNDKDKDKKIDWLTVIIPAFNAEKELASLLPLLNNNFKSILVGIDGKTNDNSVAICEKNRVKYIIIKNSLPIAEPLIWTLAEESDHDYLLRLDADEIPSIELIEALKRINEIPSGTDIIGIARSWIFPLESNGRITYDASIGPDYQWRLFNKRKVAYVNWVHSSGVITDESRLKHFTKDCSIFHLHHLTASSENINQKLKLYESVKSGAGYAQESYYSHHKGKEAREINNVNRPLIEAYIKNHLNPHE